MRSAFRLSAVLLLLCGGVGPLWADVDPAQTVLLQGKVFGPEDRPVAGARLSLNIDEWTDPIELGTTGADGGYRFAVPEQTLRRVVSSGFHLAKCQASLMAAAEGFGPGWVELPSIEGHRLGQMKHQYVHGFQLKDDCAIAGRVKDANGKPVHGAEIAVVAMFELDDPDWYKMKPAIEANDPKFMTRDQTNVNNWSTTLYQTAWRAITPATTDADGRFRLAGVGADRAVRLRVTGPGVKSHTVSVLTRDDAEKFAAAVRAEYLGLELYGPAPTIEVAPARTIAGVVRDADSGEPIAGIDVIVAHTYGRAKTDRHGRYRLERQDGGWARFAYVDATDSERHLTVVRPLTDAASVGEVVLDFDVPRGVAIEGRVLEAESGLPILSAPSSSCHVRWPGPLQAGYVYYFPLATNAALRGTPTGLYYEALPRDKINYSLSTKIDPEGRFRMAVPPGPGVILVESRPGTPGDSIGYRPRQESEGLHELFPYAVLASRTPGDGAPEGDGQSFPGFTGPISLRRGDHLKYHAYQVIDPPADAERLDLTLNVRREPTLRVRFVNPEGNPLRDVKVIGLSPPKWRTMVLVDDREAEVVGLSPNEPRELLAATGDGKYVVRTEVRAEDAQPRLVQLEPAASVSGRLVDDASGRPLARYEASIRHEVQPVEWVYPLVPSIEPVKTDGDGRFQLGGLLPGQAASLAFLAPEDPKKGWSDRGSYKPESLQQLLFGVGEVLDVGDIRVSPGAEAETAIAPGQ